jgi:hypothetical protein
MADDNSDLVQSVPRPWQDKLSMGLQGLKPVGAQTPNPMEKVIGEHYQERLHQAQKAQQDLAMYTAALASGIDPETHQKMTPEAQAKYESLRKQAEEVYTKQAGVGKQGKEMVKDHLGKLGTLLHFGKQHQQAQAGAQPQGMPPPPAKGSAAAPMSEQTPIGGSSAQLPPPPKYDAAAQADAPRLRKSMADDAEFSQWDRKQKALRDYKIVEEQAKAKADAEAKAANPSGRPVMGPATSVKNAKELAKQGKVFDDKDGNPIDLTTLPDSMGLKFIAWGGKHFYEPFSPNSKVLTVGNETFAVSPMDVESLKDGAGTDLGQKNVGTTSRTTDPTTGQTTTSTHTPSTTGVSGRGAQPSVAPVRKGALPAPPKSGAAPAKKDADVTLDEQGHIAPSVVAPPQVVEGANQLLDGTDKDKLPAKTRELSAALARKAGWEQGKFTPKEQVLLKESTTFLKQALDDPSLKVLDDTMSSLKLEQVLAGADKQGFIGSVGSTLAAKNMTNDEAAFVRMYNQLVGTISGLGQLVRTGRITEASINRLKAELPNPKTTQGSADAKRRIKRLLKEVDVAMEKGTFEGTGKAASNKLSAPPAKASDTPSGIDKEIIDAAKAAQGGK